MKSKLLIVDDEKNMRWAIHRALEKEGYAIFEASNGKEGVEAFEKNQPDVVLLDLKMPVMDGMEALKKIREIDSTISILMLTAHGTMETAIEAMKLGAMDYLSKPFDVEELKVQIRKALHVRELEERISYFREEAAFETGNIVIGESKPMKDLMSMVERVASTPATILILGESGTGKEIIAHLIHYNSPRKEKPFIKVNCGAIPETLIESELFGHEKGAFTGAVSRKMGKFERARGGTILLDEIGELDLSMQVKLLRVLQDKVIERVGGSEEVPVDVRVIAATNRQLKKMVEEGTFREDLYYRLNVIPLHIPSLRDRKEDIPAFVQHFLQHYCKEMGRGSMSISTAAMNQLVNHPWKGNVRELENFVERLVILSPEDEVKTVDLNTGKIGSLDVEAENKQGIQLPENGLSLDEVEKNLILQALERTGDNQTKAAQLLGISRHTLMYRMDKYGIRE
ncbi:DNA-binding transcriptional response regulator, NtrC family, contains REC, AAA-type ATPase, and a Fis-type DNA-binding domains [Tindallia magadiensis]|uniref:Stage 0 sporulation protein A homolog n=1 Tax=Tindallia magadiensis TaxID=69895 RepID=A0A1I3DCH9_9FIRM|nr:sigma-54 dependent transcriptional regulator [Tindallia magadiensis]SFH84181.1 DNA-binding transcriptional response regulator, NtrC family, contains REC, AAA-type ATPase, and a Fis-type DNA-binding domains [Tindallia magadiensis]